ncbi:MAG TPA: metalloregulator ArsR/SmtB family transcription factor [Gemmatimonadales bacterium]|nr:metalloregulator ArsR/SmtB family transcription factor [Gemmatimonadales bacterium]
MPPAPSTTEILVALAEPTRLRILNCLAAAPLFVSDLQAVLEVPQPTVSRHLKVLKEARLVRDTPIAQFVLYRLRRETGTQGRLLSTALDALAQEEQMRTERHRAADRSRANPRVRVATLAETAS